VLERKRKRKKKREKEKIFFNKNFSFNNSGVNCSVFSPGWYLSISFIFVST
jgi:hypothetical protein